MAERIKQLAVMVLITGLAIAPAVLYSAEPVVLAADVCTEFQKADDCQADATQAHCGASEKCDEDGTCTNLKGDSSGASHSCCDTGNGHDEDCASCACVQLLTSSAGVLNTGGSPLSGSESGTLASDMSTSPRHDHQRDLFRPPILILS